MVATLQARCVDSLPAMNPQDSAVTNVMQGCAAKMEAARLGSDAPGFKPFWASACRSRCGNLWESLLGRRAATNTTGWPMDRMLALAHGGSEAGGFVGHDAQNS